MHMETRKRKTRSDLGKRHAGHGNRQAKGRKKGRTLLLKVFSLPEDTADFIRYEQTLRNDDDPRDTVKALLAEQALAWHDRRHAALDPSQYIL